MRLVIIECYYKIAFLIYSSSNNVSDIGYSSDNGNIILISLSLYQSIFLSHSFLFTHSHTHAHMRAHSLSS